jgi:hypothetical protein
MRVAFLLHKSNWQLAIGHYTFSPPGSKNLPRSRPEQGSQTSMKIVLFCRSASLRSCLRQSGVDLLRTFPGTCHRLAALASAAYRATLSRS